jgi:tRNA pseudouridine55 synthase
MYKKVGETPLQALDRLRLEQARLVGVGDGGVKIPLSYAGRLDPMASGVLLVLVGDECKDREKFLELDKEYVCQVMWGFETDTHDILGKVTRNAFAEEKPEDAKNGYSFFENFSVTPEILQKFVGKSLQKFPAFSSKPVKGKALHEWARSGRLNEIEIPSKEIEVKSIELLGSKKVAAEQVLNEIVEKISLVKGDFRQEEILRLWRQEFAVLKERDAKENEEFSEGIKGQEILISEIKISCSSGTYIRKLVSEIGQLCGVGATVFSLNRTRVGAYN